MEGHRKRAVIFISALFLLAAFGGGLFYFFKKSGLEVAETPAAPQPVDIGPVSTSTEDLLKRLTEVSTSSGGKATAPPPAPSVSRSQLSTQTNEAVSRLGGISVPEATDAKTEASVDRLSQ